MTQKKRIEPAHAADRAADARAVRQQGELVQKTGTLTFKLAKLMIAVSWADGNIDNSEVDALKELLFSLPELDAREWAELEIYMDSPVDESEREGSAPLYYTITNASTMLVSSG